MNKPKAKKITLFVPTLTLGGAQKVFINLAQGFEQIGIDVDFIAANAVGPFLASIKGNIQLIDLLSPRVYKSLPGLVRYLKKEKPDALISALGHTNVIAIAAKIIARSSAKIIVTDHSMLSNSIANAPTRRGRWFHIIMRWMYPYADHIVAVSKNVADDLVTVIGIGRSRIEVINNPAVTPELLQLSKETVDHPWFKKKSSPVILAAGRLHPVKDFPTLIKAFSIVRNRMDAKLVILGTGDEQHNLELLIKKLSLTDDVQLLGYTKNPFAYMAKSSVFVLSSLWEGSPTVLVEALACGCPVVSTDCPGGSSEILEGGKWGTLVQVGDINGMAQAIENILTKKVVQEKGSRYEDFTVSTITGQYYHLIFKE